MKTIYNLTIPLAFVATLFLTAFTLFAGAGSDFDIKTYDTWLYLIMLAAPIVIAIGLKIIKKHYPEDEKDEFQKTSFKAIVYFVVTALGIYVLDFIGTGILNWLF